MNEEHSLKTEEIALLDFPKMAVLSLTYVCNARCTSCAYTNSSIRSDYDDAKYLDEGTFRRIADECGRHRTWLRFSSGGETMLHPQVIEFAQYGIEKGCNVGVITNGSLMTEEKAKKLLSLGIDMVEFSVDAGDEETYGKVRKGLSWEKVVRNVKATVSLRNQMKANTKIIASAVNQKGVDIDQAAAFWEPIVDVFQKRKYLTWGINDPSLSADQTPYLPPERKTPCPIVFERLFIDTRGDAHFCIYDIAGKTRMGNVNRQSIREIWHNPEFERARQLHLKGQGDQIEMCKGCEDWKYRSWKHNYWKIVKNAEGKREDRLFDSSRERSE